MSIEEQLNEMRQNVANSYVKVKSKGGTLPNDRNLANLPDAIDSISTGGGSPNLGTLTIVNNNVYNASSYGYDGFSSVDVQVTPVLTYLNATENKTYMPQDYGAVGFDTVDVNVPEGFFHSTTKTKAFASISQQSWQTTTFSGYDVNGFNVFNMWGTIYYADGSNWYQLNTSTLTWTLKSSTTVIGRDVWTDGANYYCSMGANQFVYSMFADTWQSYSGWSGLTNFWGRNVWALGMEIFYDNADNNDHWSLNISTGTWSRNYWDGEIPDYGRKMWTDGCHIYHTNDDVTIQLDENSNTWFVKNWASNVTINDGSYVWYDGENTWYSDGTASGQYLLFANHGWYDIFHGNGWTVNTQGTEQPKGDNIWTYNFMNQIVWTQRSPVYSYILDGRPTQRFVRTHL